MTKAKDNKRRATKGKPAQQDNSKQGHSLPTIGVAPVNKLDAVAVTLMRNLESTPMRHWKEPILSALQSAFNLGRASVDGTDEQSEDKALERAGRTDNLEEVGYDFVAQYAKHFGALSQMTGLVPHELKFRWMVFNTAEGEQVLGMLPVIPKQYAPKIPK